MRRAIGLALSVALVVTAGAARAADAEPGTAADGASKIGAFSNAAGAFARAVEPAPAPAPAAATAPAAAAAPAAEPVPGTSAPVVSPASAPLADASDTASAAKVAGVAATATVEEPADANAAPAAAAVPAAVPGSRPAAASAPAAGDAVPGVDTPVAVPGVALLPAKQLFGAVKTAAPIAARALGSYSRGCLAGAKALPVDGPQWQAMRLSRNRNWGHPDLIQLIQRLSDETWRYDGWNGLLVGDISQPRGGPMLTGHASHQLGLDADIWLTPMPDRRLSNKEREDLSATSMIGADEVHIDARVWTPGHVKIIKRVASYDRVERVLVHPGIKQALCAATAGDGDRAWLHKVRPYWGHNYHFHMRIGCPPGSPGCTPQPPTPGDDGCGKELAEWLQRVTPKPPEPKVPGAVVPAKPPPPPVTLADLPQECRMVLTSGTPGIPKPLLEKQRQTDIALAQRAKALAAAQAARHAAAASRDAVAKGKTADDAAAEAAPALPAASTAPLPAAAVQSAPTTTNAR